MAVDPNDIAETGVADPEEFNQTQRLRTINEVKKQAGDAIQATMTRLRTDEGFDESDRQQILRAAIYRYLTEIEWLAHQADDSEILQQANFGTVELQPSPQIQKLVKTKDEGYPRVVGAPSLKKYKKQIHGIRGYLTAPQVFEETWSVKIDTLHEGVQNHHDRQASYMPVHVSLNAYRRANQFLAENGIDIELAEKQHRAVVDNELVEEVEQWRQQNIQ